MKMKKLTIGTLFAGAMLAGSIAFAAWTATGAGSGYAKASSAQALTTVDVSASTTATLYPGATGDVLLRIANPNPYPVTVTDVAGSGVIDSDTTAACDASTGVSFTDQTGLTLNVPASGAATFTLSGSVAMANSSHTSCQGLHDPGHAVRGKQRVTERHGCFGRLKVREDPPFRHVRTEVDEREVPQRAVIVKLSIVSVLTLVTALARASEHAPSYEGSAATAVGKAAPPRFQISGRVDGLFPGVRTQLRLSVRNPNPFAIVLTRIRTTVQRASGTCPPGTIRIQRFNGSRRISALGVKRVTLMVRMLLTAPNACIGQRYRLSCRGSATLA